MRLLRSLIPIFTLLLLGAAALLPASPAAAQSCSWSHTFDFTASDGGWAAIPLGGSWSGGDVGSWSSGVGWVHEDIYLSSSERRAVYISIEFPSSTITSVKIYASYTAGSFAGVPGGTRQSTVGGGGSIVMSNVFGSGSVPDPISWSGSTTIDQLDVFYSSSYTTSGWSGSATITSVEVEGTGDNPFTGLSECPPVASFTMDTDSGAAPLAVSFTDTSTGTPTSWLWDFGDGETSTAQNPSHEYSEAGTYTVTLTATNADGSDDATDTVFVTPGIGSPGGSLYLPLQADDANDNIFGDGIWANGSDMGIVDFAFGQIGGNWLMNSHTVVASSRAAGSPVFAAADGMVASITHMVYPECPGIPTNALLGCFFFYADIFGEVSTGALFQVPLENLYKVVVTYGDEGDSINYYVANAPEYVYVGMTIRGGCVVGETILFNAIDLAEMEVGGGGSVGGSAGVTANVDGGGSITITLDDVYFGGGALVELKAANGSPQPLINYMSTEPSLATACNADPAFANCLPFDQQFRKPNEWTPNDINKVNFTIGGVELRPGGAMTYSGIPLDETTAYRFTVSVVVANGDGAGANGRIQLKLGNSSVTHIVVSGGVTKKSVELAMHEPDEGSLYSVQIANVGSRSLWIFWNCISENTDGSPQSQCYFANFDFMEFENSETAAWAVYSVAAIDFGQIMLDDEAAIGQNVYLYPDADSPHEYTIKVEWAWHRWAEDGAVGTPVPDVQFEYRFNSDPYEDFGTQTSYREIDSSFSEVTTQTVSVSEPIDGEFRLRVDIDPKTYSGELFVLIREVCIYDDFAHHPKGDGTLPGGSINIGDDPAVCSPAIRPDISSTVNVGAWVNYLWLNLRNFFYCNLEPLLEKIAAIANDTLQLVRWQILYWQASGARLMAWSGNSLIPWLGGHFANMAFGRQTTVIQEAEGCNNLFCLLQSLVEEILSPVVNLIVNFLTQVIDLLYKLIDMALDLLGTLASAIVRLIAEVINLITTLVQFVRMYLFAFISAITNAQPVPMDGLPNCSDDPQSTSWCMAFYGLDKTVFAAEGQLIIPVFIGVLAVMQLIWLAQKISELIERIGGGL